MQFLVFALTYPLIWLLSRLPMRILYGISDFFYILLYYVFGYRKKVVAENLQLSFPEKSEKEILSISKKFFRHFTDLIMESVKAFSISEKEILKRYKHKNPELVNEYAKDGRSIVLVSSHQANWEWFINIPLLLDIDVYGAYTKLQNRYFEKKVKKSRGKFGAQGFKDMNFMEGVKQNSLKKKQGVYILISDQSPQVHKTYYWKELFGIKVPVHTGAEMIAKSHNLVVINYVAKKIKRGYFEVEFELITDQPKAFKDYEITDKYLEILEKNIRQQPEFYLWSHRRFKHRDKVPKEFL